MNDAADHPTIIHPFDATNIRGQTRLNLKPLLIAQPK
jgi:hypothetical protein